jgi:hypothetical protein
MEVARFIGLATFTALPPAPGREGFAENAPGDQAVLGGVR